MPSNAEPLGLRSGRPGKPIAVALALGAVAITLYGMTCAPGVCWQDSGFHQYRIASGQLMHPRGLALSHPLHYWLGRAALALPLPLGEPAYRLNLLSVLFGAATVGALSGVTAAITRSAIAGALAGVTLLCAHSFWQMSVVTETYTLSAALMTAEWIVLSRYARTRSLTLLVVLFAINGLNVSNHLLGLLSGVTYVALAVGDVMRGRIAARWILVLAAAWLAAAAPYWTLALWFHATTQDISTTFHSALFGGTARNSGWSSAVLNTRVTADQLQLAVLSLGYCFPSFALLIALVGLTRRSRRRQRLFWCVLLAQTIIIFAFVVRYPIADLYTYFTPVCVLVALWFGIGAAWLLRRPDGLAKRAAIAAALFANALIPLATYANFPRWAEQRGLLRQRLRDLPFRNEYHAFFRPWQRGDDSAARYASWVLAQVGPAGWILADDTTAPAIAYWQLAHSIPADIRIYSERIALTAPDMPLLSVDAVDEFVRRGGAAVLIPGGNAERIWAGQFPLDKSAADMWRVAARND